MDLTYTLERYDTDTDADNYIRKYRNVDYFLQFCRQCRNYGRRYGCPPFQDDPLAAISKYASVRIIGVKIIPNDKSLPLDAANELMEPVTRELNEELLRMEESLH